MKVAYPTIFTDVGKNILIEVPDLGILTEANEEGKRKGTFYGEGKSILSLVDVDLAVYRRILDNKTVRRNVIIPNWLNQEAEKAHLNVSKVLQEALMSRLGVSH